MRDLYEYIVDERFTVAGTESNKILLFDVDNTLIDSDVKVYVMKDNKLVKKISSTEYNSYKLQQGEYFDYSEFESEDILNNKSVFLKYWDTLQREYKKGTHIGILTARSDIKMIKKFFLKKGIDIKDDLIFAIGDESLNLTSKSIEEKKAECIKRLFEVGYNTFVFFDDNQSNLDSAEELEMELPIDIITVKA